MGNYYTGYLQLRFNKETGDKFLSDFKILSDPNSRNHKDINSLDPLDFSILMKNARWLTHSYSARPRFALQSIYDTSKIQLSSQINNQSSTLPAEILQEKILQEINDKGIPCIGYELQVNFCMKLYTFDFDLGKSIVDFFRPYLDSSMYDGAKCIGSIHDEDGYYCEEFFVDDIDCIAEERSSSNVVKRNAIHLLEDIHEQLGSVIEQLKTKDVAYYTNSEVASIIPAIPGMEWGGGMNPKTGKKSFTAYFIDFKRR